eukprot:TRINITY_DN13919_c0_g1_i1.p1 TRINITY_DN13919_c0_g1~~TRINITY_DN13919_c0_g1_i1.p1  ORF type:complete len:131 (+),score=10.50 TRINITY_DN13919_c0_g1_i1:142-534(+)
MVVRLHPGQNRKLSTMEDQEEAPGDQSEQMKNSCGWLAEVQAEDDPSSVCGLEISFKSVPQDIDIKLISGQQQQEKAVVKPAAKTSQCQRTRLLENLLTCHRTLTRQDSEHLTPASRLQLNVQSGQKILN